MTGDLMIAALLDKTITYDSPDSRRIAHLVKVNGYARAIGLLEGLDEQTPSLPWKLKQLCTTSAYKYEGKSSGALQEREGPPTTVRPTTPSARASAPRSNAGWEDSFPNTKAWHSPQTPLH